MQDKLTDISVWAGGLMLAALLAASSLEVPGADLLLIGTLVSSGVLLNLGVAFFMATAIASPQVVDEYSMHRVVLMIAAFALGALYGNFAYQNILPSI